MRPSRRELLAATLLAGACASTRTPRADRMRFGLVTYMWGSDLALDELLLLSETAGIAGLELRTTHRHGVEPELDARARADVRARFAHSPVTLVGLGSDERFDSPDPDVVGASIERTRAFLRLAADVGAGGVKVKPNAFHAGVPREATLEQIGRSLATLGPEAADLGLELRLEAHGDCAPAQHLFRILETADHPAVRLCWNSNAVDLDPPGLASNLRLVARHLGAVVHVRRQDSPDYPYTRLYDLLREVGWSGWVMLEQGGALPADRLLALREQVRLFRGRAVLS